MTRFDVFRLDNGSPIWVGASATIEDAHAQASQISDCSECLILDQMTGEKVLLKIESESTGPR